MSFFADAQTATGRSREHLLDTPGLDRPVHRDAVEPLARLREAAAKEGMDLRLVSAFRSFEDQLAIWNAKAAGRRPVLNDESQPLDINKLPPKELALAILRWSALPGGSRHHWGTDIDVYDATALPDGYEVQLVPEEYAPGGPFEKLGRWLDARCAPLSPEGFFRPYAEDRGGVAVEPWHLSWRPAAEAFERVLTQETLREAVASSGMELRGAVLEALDAIYGRFIRPGRALP